MADIRLCNRCGNLLPSDAPDGTCPACTLSAELEPEGPAGANLTFGFESAQPGHVLESLARSIGSIPRVLLPDTVSDDTGVAIVKPLSDEMPAAAERGNRYQLFGELARGGMGAVLKGRDPDLGRDLTVKVLLESHEDKPELVRRFVEEAQIGGQLQHPGIVPVYELGAFADRRPYFTMKLVKGRTLASLLGERESPAHDLPRFLSIFESICQTVAYAHARGVIHRNLKPSNVMVGSFGEVQVMDWGLAKVLKEGGVDDELPAQPVPELSVIATVRSSSNLNESQAGSVLGTPAYMAPEQAEGDIVHVDRRADVFGLGSILCEILTSQPAYTGRSSMENLRKAMRGDTADAVTRLDGCGAEAEMVALAKDCLAVEPDDRPRDSGALAQRVTAYLSGVQERLRSAELERARAEARALEERKRRRVSLALAATVLGTVLLSGGGWAWVSREREAHEREALSRRTKAAVSAEQALAEVAGLRERARSGNNPAAWARARARAEQADGLLAEAADPTLTARVRALTVELTDEEADLKLIDRLREVRLARYEATGSARAQALNLIRSYREAFAGRGLTPGGDEPAAAAWVRRRPAELRERLLAGLDGWLTAARYVGDGDADWLVRVAQGADDDGWRKDLRGAVGRGDAAALERLAGSKELDRQLPETLMLLAEAVRPRSYGQALVVLRAARRRDPADFAVNAALGYHGMNWADARSLGSEAYEEPSRFLSVAHGLRPGNAKVLSNLGAALDARGLREEGLDAMRRAVALGPDDPFTHTQLGRALLRRERFGEAEAEIRESLRIDVNSVGALEYLGTLLVSRLQIEEALAVFRHSERLDPDYFFATDSVGVMLCLLGRLEEAAATFHSALRRQADVPTMKATVAVLDLIAARRLDDAAALARAIAEAAPENPNSMMLRAIVLATRGDFAQARTQIERATARVRKDVYGRNPSTTVAFVRLLVRLAALGPDLDEYVRGDRHAADDVDRHMLLFLCWVRHRPRAAAELGALWEAKDPKWFGDSTAEHRHDAARWAARAAAAEGDAAKLPEAERSRWRRRSLGWLRADLAFWKHGAETGTHDQRAEAAGRLGWWLEDRYFADVQDPKALAQLPANERVGWQILWAEVEAARKTAASDASK